MKRVGEMLGIKTEETTIVSVTNEEEKQPELPKAEPAKQETTAEEPSITTNSLPEENPLFSNNLPDLNEQPADPEDDNNFWFPSDMPDALNELPDLEVSNDNFFANNNIPDLNFPDLKINFGPDEEVK